MKFPQFDPVEFLGNTIAALICLILTTIVIIGLFFIVKCVSTKDEIESCYINVFHQNSIGQEYKLYGYVPWHSDKNLGSYASLNEAVDAANKIQCKLIKK